MGGQDRRRGTLATARWSPRISSRYTTTTTSTSGSTSTWMVPANSFDQDIYRPVTLPGRLAPAQPLRRRAQRLRPRRRRLGLQRRARASQSSASINESAARTRSAMPCRTRCSSPITRRCCSIPSDWPAKRARFPAARRVGDAVRAVRAVRRRGIHVSEHGQTTGCRCGRRATGPSATRTSWSG